MREEPKPVCVYCASSPGHDPEHMRIARRLGELLAESSRPVVYGGSRMGTMGALAEGVLSRDGRVIGIMPGFLQRLEIAHASLSELHIVEDMRARKHAMLALASAVICLPGGIGTFEELLEAITLKKLGIHAHPIIVVDTKGFYRPMLELFDKAEQEGFFASPRQHFDMVSSPEEALALLAKYDA